MGKVYSKGLLSYRGKPSIKTIRSQQSQGDTAEGRGPTMQKVVRDIKTKQRFGHYKTER